MTHALQLYMIGSLIFNITMLYSTYILPSYYMLTNLLCNVFSNSRGHNARDGGCTVSDPHQDTSKPWSNVNMVDIESCVCQTHSANRYGQEYDRV